LEVAIMLENDKDESALKAPGAGRANAADPPSEVKEVTDDEVVDAWWRGVFCSEVEREVLFTMEFDVDMEKLPRWEPYIHIEPPTESDDDE
jgi:hypothetical protein